MSSRQFCSLPGSIWKSISSTTDLIVVESSGGENPPNSPRPNDSTKSPASPVGSTRATHAPDQSIQERGSKNIRYGLRYGEVSGSRPTPPTKFNACQGGRTWKG